MKTVTIDDPVDVRLDVVTTMLGVHPNATDAPFRAARSVITGIARSASIIGAIAGADVEGLGANVAPSAAVAA